MVLGGGPPRRIERVVGVGPYNEAIMRAVKDKSREIVGQIFEFTYFRTIERSVKSI